MIHIRAFDIESWKTNITFYQISICILKSLSIQQLIFFHNINIFDAISNILFTYFMKVLIFPFL